MLGKFPDSNIVDALKRINVQDPTMQSEHYGVKINAGVKINF